MTVPKYIPIKNYFEQLCYDYIDTYSFNRGLKLDEVMNKKKYSFSDINSTRLTDSGGVFNVTSEKIGRIDKGSSAHLTLERIVATVPVGTSPWMCGPVYRDALVFYSKSGEIVDVLNICFSCSHLSNAGDVLIETGENIYDQLKNLLCEVGHKIDPEEASKLSRQMFEFFRGKPQ